MAFEALKAKHSVVWGSGRYERISAHLRIAHDDLLAAVEPRAGARWLDVATGTGEIAVPAAASGARVTGLDLAPELIERARAPAAAADSPTRTRASTSSARPSASSSRRTTAPRRLTSPASVGWVGGSPCATGMRRAASPSSSR
jgi:SAM-dependent methyltransferase